MSTEKMREGFQEWWRHREQTELRSSCAMGWAFLIWQASRAAIVVELPQGFTHHGASDQTECVLEAGAVVAAIESLGLKVKP